MSIFTINHEDNGSGARTGVLSLPHGETLTPVFMPVGTNGTVKAVSVYDLKEIGFDLVLSNTYHLYLRPGTGVLKEAGGLHKFMNWDKNILTDSGGFQVFSLSDNRKIKEEGVYFKSHIDGSPCFFSPESVVEIQSLLGSDIIMQLDVCSPWGVGRDEAVKALETTTLWMIRSKKAWLENGSDKSDGNCLRSNYLFPIVQGNFFKDLRKESAERVIETDCPGIAIGGLSVGEPEEAFYEYLAFTAALLPKEKPRYVMGIGTPQYILSAIENGIDMFDCVFPTRTARNGLLFSRKGSVSIKKHENTHNFVPIDEECGCKVCREYTRAYLRHLFKSQEILYSMLASYHNLYFLNNIITDARAAINEDRFVEYKSDFLARYTENKDESEENN